MSAADVIIDSDVTNLDGRRLWGGLILSGFAPTAFTDTNHETISEASAPENPTYYGGQNPRDSSGLLTYLIVAETGRGLRVNRETQAITLQGTGSLTNLDSIQVINPADDCIEFIGGAASVTHLVCINPEDDGIDIDDGYAGNIQFAIVTIGFEGYGNHGIEADGTRGLLPLASPILMNITIIGDQGRSVRPDTTGTDFRDEFQGKIYQSAFIDATDVPNIPSVSGFSHGCIEISSVVSSFEIVDSIIGNSCIPALRR